jgi:transmembrane sensor
MSENVRPPCEDGQLREEAANWFAAMRGPEAQKHQPEFDAWLARGALHRQAYNRIAETFALGKRLKDDATYVEADASGPTEPSVDGKLGPVLLLLSALAGGGFVLSSAWRSAANTDSPDDLVRQEYVQSAVRTQSSGVGEIRQVRLEDGSRLTLDTDSLVTIAYSPALRFVRLERGRARFDIVPNNRPFRVDVGRDTITAQSSQFDARRASEGGVTVSTLHGAVEFYRAPEGRNDRGPGTALRLVAGERADARHPFSSLLEADSPIKEAGWPQGLIDFDQATLADVTAYANRYSTTPVILADNDLGRMKVSGTFKVSDPAKLTARLADIFNLAIEPTSDAEYRLHRR